MGGNKFNECEFCTYRWISRVQNPKSCPRCKRRFDYKEALIVLQELSKKFGYDLMRGYNELRR